jgi:hypothetical protein
MSGRMLIPPALPDPEPLDDELEELGWPDLRRALGLPIDCPTGAE